MCQDGLHNAEQDVLDTNQMEEPFPHHIGVFDAHCHPTDTIASLDQIPDMRARVLTIMATRDQDQDLVAECAEKHGLNIYDDDDEEDKRALCHVIPSFGWHPWFSHQLYDDTQPLSDSDPTAKLSRVDHYNSVLTPSPANEQDLINSLPEPRPLSEFLMQTRERLKKYKLAMVGEVGLDRSFRLPNPWSPDQEASRDPSLTPGTREGRRLSPYRVQMDHQRKILKAQLQLAGEMQRSVSVHGVAAHGVLHDTLQETWKGHEKPVVSSRTRKRRGSVPAAHVDEDEVTKSDIASSKPFPPRVCLHSYSGPTAPLRQYLHPSVPTTIFFSFSQVINFSTPAAQKTVEVIKAVPDDRILIESDLHTAGERMDTLLEQMAREVCKIKNWDLEAGVKQLKRNWIHFALGVANDDVENVNYESKT